jgi:hypothetical protein
MSSETIKQFNEILSSFLVQVSPLVGTSYHYQLQQIIKINSLLPLEQFMIYALPLREKILNRDETYFSDSIDNNTMFSKEHSKINEILRFKDIYFRLDSESKSNVWDICQAMLILGEEYIRANCDKYTKN